MTTISTHAVVARGGFHAMGCRWSIWLATSDQQRAAWQLHSASTFVQATESRLTRFRPDSELCALNAHSADGFVASPLLWAIATFALDAALLTDGLFDPTVLPALEAIGYDRTFAHVVDSPEAPAPLDEQCQRWRSVTLDHGTHSITMPPGTRLDLGGVAKGWVAGHVARCLAVMGPCLVDAGGDVVVHGAPPDADGWSVGIADPFRPEEDIAELMLRDCAVATSGTDYRRWRRGKRIVHHIIDPRTGRPADTDVTGATVIAESLPWAEVHAKAALILGSHAGLDHLRLHGLKGLLVCNNGARLRTGGLCEAT